MKQTCIIMNNRQHWGIVALCVMEKKYSLQEKIEAVSLLRQNNFDYALISNTLKIPEGTLHRWNDKHGPTVKDGLQECAETAKVVTGTCTDAYETNSKFLSKVEKVRGLALDRLELILPTELDSKKLIEVIKSLNDISNESIGPGKTGGNFFMQFIEKQYINKHGHKNNTSSSTGDAT